MNMWDQNFTMAETRLNNSKLFPKRPDDEANATVSPTCKAIFDTDDYGWFIRSLKTELSLDREETASSSKDRTMRQQIRSMLGLTSISKRGFANNLQVVFRFPTPSIDCVGSDPIVVTSNSQNLQLTRVSTYVDQTWPAFGNKILNAISSLWKELQDPTPREASRSSKTTL